MASTGRIQSAARGLLQFLRMVGTGQEPVDLAGEVVGTVDLRNHYAVDFLERVTQQASPMIATTTVQLVVPNNQFWRVRSIAAVSVHANIGDIASLSTALRVTPVTISRLSFQPPVTTLTVSGAIVSAAWLGEGLILKAGMRLQARCEDATIGANPATLNLEALIERYPR